MQTRTFLTLALLSAMPLAAHAQGTPNLSGVPVTATPAAGTAQPVTLRLKFTPGRTLYYNLIADTNGMMQNAMVQGAVPITTHVDIRLHQTVKSVRAADGAATIETGVDALTYTMNGEVNSLSPDKLAQVKTVGTTVILPTGKVLSFTPNPALGRSPMPGMDMSHTNALGSLGQLPDAPVKTGDTWKSIVSMGMAGVQTASVFTLSNVDTTGGKTIAVVDQATDGEFDSATVKDKDVNAMPLGMDAKGKVTGIGKLRFDVDAGALESAVNHSDLTMTLGQSADAPGTTLQMKITTTMKRVEAPKPAATAAAH